MITMRKYGKLVVKKKIKRFRVVQKSTDTRKA